jgi:hypothetical protein
MIEQLSGYHSCFWIQEALGSNHNPEIGYPDQNFFLFFLSPSRQCWDTTSNYTIITSLHILSSSLLTKHPAT